jgi:Protein of unknown function (DUF3455)
MKRLLRRLLPIVAVFGLVVYGTSPPASQMRQSEERNNLDRDDLDRHALRSVLTQHNDSMRTGAYLVEKQLTPAAVDSATGPGMQLRYWRPVDGNLHAQLLYARNQIGHRGGRDVIYAFTDRNTVYAYNANEERNPGTSQGLIWSRTLPATPHPTLHTSIGIVGTPVIDLLRRAVYLVYGVSNGLFPIDGVGDGMYEVEFHLAALDSQSGSVLRDLVVSGSAPSSVPPGPVDFVARRQIQRAGLLLAPNPVARGRRTVYVAFASRWREETHNWHGWVMGYDAETFAPRGVFCSTPDRRANSEGGGIWQGGAGLAADKAGNVYFNTGNGPGSGNDHGNSIVKLTPVRRMSGAYDFDVAAFSAAADDPAHAFEWANNDIDLAGGGVTVIPGSSQLVGGGKTGVLYLMDQPTMTKLQSFEAFNNTYDPCPPPSSTCSRYRDWMSGPHLHGAPTYWEVSRDKGLVFHWSEKDYLKRFDHDRLGSGLLIPASALSGDVQAEAHAMPGGLISLSANHTRDGLLWITLPWKDGGRIFAYDALALRRLWDTTVPSPLSHNNPPTVADGRVIVGSTNGEFLVYGLGRGGPLVYDPASILPIPLFDPGPWILELLGRLSPRQAAAIAPPQGHRPRFLALGSGALTYEARLTRQGTSVEWVLVGVGGELRDQSGVMPNLGYGGLGVVLATAGEGFAWTAPDGSRARWSVETSVNAPQTGDAPWVLFRSVASGAPEQAVRGGGLLGAVTYVQQMGTAGGAAPGTAGRVGDRIDVPYTAIYAFYVAAVDSNNHSRRAH